MFGPDSGRGSWVGLKFMYEKVRVGSGERCQRRVNTLLEVRPHLRPFNNPVHPFFSLYLHPSASRHTNHTKQGIGWDPEVCLWLPPPCINCSA